MPQIRQYTRQNLPNQLIGNRASASSFGGDVSGLEAQARSSQQMSQALGQLEASVSEVIKKREQSEYFEKISAFELENMRRQEELATQEFEDEGRISEYYQQDLEQRAEQLDIPKSMQDRFQRDLANMRLNYVGAGMREQARRAGVKAKLNFENTQTNVVNGIAMGAINAERGMELLSSQIDALPNLAGVDKKTMKDLAADNIMSAVANTESAKNPSQFLKDAKSGKYSDTPDLASYIQRAESKIERDNNKIIAERKSAIRDDYTNFVNYTKAGLVYNRDKAEKLAKSAENSGMEDLANDIRLRSSVQDSVSEFIRNKPLASQVDVLQSKLAQANETSSPEALFELQSYQKAYAEKVDAIQSGEAIEYYSKVGVIDAPETWDVTSTESFALGYAERRRNQRIIAERDGVLVPIITKDEANKFSDYYASLSSNEQVEYIRGLSAVADGEDLSLMAKMVGGKDDNLATALALSGSAPDVASQIIRGSQRKKNIPVTDVRETLTPDYGPVIGDPVAYEMITSAIHNYLEDDMARTGQTIATPDDIKSAAYKVVGKPITFGSSAVLPFKKDNGEFISESEFKTVTSQLNTYRLRQKLGDVPYVKGKPVDDEWLQEALFSWELVSVDDGKYRLQNGGDVLVDRAGNPYIFDYKRIYKDIDTRGYFAKTFDNLGSFMSDAVSPLEQ